MVIVITGPIASGKSTISRELARELERTHDRVAVIDLDVVHDGLVPGGSTSDDATWELARHAAATQANAFLAEGVAVVIAEGSFNTPGDRSAFVERLDPCVAPLVVTLRVSYEEALRRAQGDPTRGVSRDPAFLGRHFAAHEALTAGPATDIVIDTEAMSATSAAAAIASLIRTSSTWH
ncbi:MAG TPA: AAA family ATPase [Candidatus Limnocylindrales bacterium]|nr:AAA family ATPase [Candidatus Limnocylindrales bacterium]